MTRDRRFIRTKRGGELSDREHRLLMIWACKCSEHVFTLAGNNPDPRLLKALETGVAWASGSATTGDAMKASVKIHSAARACANPVEIALYRSAGHAVATAHMADHSIGAALYALKAIYLSGASIDEEKNWQFKQIPDAIHGMVEDLFAEKVKHFKFQ
ncbi:MAG: hypothetical protein U0X39_11645 [Bacteroidales bacterium]